MKILHFSDLHLDRSFSEQGLSSAIGSARREGLLRRFSRICTIARERQVDVLTIAGDLYDEQFVVLPTMDLLAREFAKISPIRIFIAPGRSDPYTSNSPYALLDFPDNVHVFKQPTLTAVDISPEVRLWGAAHPSPMGATPLIGLLPSSGVNILLLHAIDSPTSEREPTFYINEEALTKSCIDFALLGGEHDKRIFSGGVFPGSPDILQPESISEKHGVILLQIENGSLYTDFIETSEWSYMDFIVDLSDCKTAPEAGGRIREKLGNQIEPLAIQQVTLMGTPSYVVRLPELRELVGGNILYKVHFSLPDSLEHLVQELTVRGLLTRRIQQRLTAIEDPDEQNRLMNVLHISIQALDGRKGIFNAIEPD